MNISKNILSLGLIAVISGISTAQTYTGTAGTNGITDIQSDYSMSTGDGASVSVDVPLEFELPKKVAIAVFPSGTGTMTTSNPLLSDITTLANYSHANSSFDFTPSSPDGPRTIGYVGFAAGIYANTSIVITVERDQYVHEADPTSIISPYGGCTVGKKNPAVWADLYDFGSQTDYTDSSVINDLTFNINDTSLATEGNKIGIRCWDYMHTDSLDATDRAGKYISVRTVTVSTL